MKKLNLTKLLEAYEDKWVALTPDKSKVVGSGYTVSEVLEKSKKNYCGTPIFFRVPSFKKGYAG
ncbi:MAG TPA: hypothetical protein DCP53_07505 [Elusimicrobia bacterium]|nr:MAG: hypothetical protein A2551_05880 [Elusimicrobia bacterium RIFOXYD2_FULL_34_30]HAM39219.1 hypothetical protein [Elusimicrobiota bacterium]